MVQFSVVHEPLIWIGIVKFCGIGMVYIESEHYCGLLIMNKSIQITAKVNGALVSLISFLLVE
jgi:hypothetical protein